MLVQRVDELALRVDELEALNRGRRGWQAIKAEAKQAQVAAPAPDFEVCVCGLVKVARDGETKCVICDSEVSK